MFVLSLFFALENRTKHRSFKYKKLLTGGPRGPIMDMPGSPGAPCGGEEKVALKTEWHKQSGTHRVTHARTETDTYTQAVSNPYPQRRG